MYNIKEFVKKNYLWIILIILFFIFVDIVTDLYFDDVIKYDILARKIFVDTIRSDAITNIMKFITFFGSGTVLITISIVSIFVFKNKRKGICICSNLLISTLLNQILKFIIQRPRPRGYNLIIESGFSFPSGHSMISAAFYGYIIYLIFTHIKNKKLKIFLSIITFLLVISIGCSRIYLGVHYASDVLAGFILAIIYLVLFIKFTDKYVLKGDNNEKTNK